MSRLLQSLATSLIIMVVGISAQQTKTAAYELILRHGTILDGTGLKPFRADLSIRNGYITEIGDLSTRQASLDLDVAGLYVAPGFINIHSHAVPAALPTAENMLTQGVTTEILNPDGGGSTDIAEQLSRSASAGLAVNIGGYIGFNSVWRSVVGEADRRPSPEEISKMRLLVESNLKQGAWGVSAGLDYKPAYFAHTDEVVNVVSVAAPWRTNFPNHERLMPETNFSWRVGIAETLEIASKAGLAPVITHMKIQGHEQGSAAAVIGMMDTATAAGHYTAADAYPYLAGQTDLGALTVPAWAQEGGQPEMIKRFQNPEMRARIAKEIEDALDARFGGAKGVYLPQTGQQLVDIMRERKTPAGETIIQILEQGYVQAILHLPAILQFGREDDLVAILRDPVTAIACDCGASLETRTHPRAFGTFPRVLGHYVRETHALTWEDAVRKMTALPANTVGIVDRGFLMPGMVADVTVFDPNTVIDLATYETPALVSEGIRYVLVNGKLALRDGKVTGERAGRTLLRSAHMPTRPMSVYTSRRVFVAAPGITINITQAAGAARAKGTFKLADPKTQALIQSTVLGFLQTTGKWASFTARAKSLPGTADRALTVVVDLDGPEPGIAVDLENAFHFAAPAPPGRIEIASSLAN
jgi:N-acyl-D-aspartate/D-glutamate deacylase